MSNYASDPDFSQILLPFLSQLPTAFSSPKPPPTLPPLLAPITRARLHHLSFNNNRPWPVYLTWSSSDSGNDLYEHLMEQDYYFLHVEISPSLYSSRGIQRVDKETLHAAVEIPEIGIVVVYIYVVLDDIEPKTEWKVFDVRLLDTDIHQEEDWRPTVREAEESYKISHPQGQGKNKSVAVETNGTNTSAQQADDKATGDNDDDDDDDYWGRYDEEDSESVASPGEQTRPAETDDDYYNRYSNVQPAMDPEDPTLPTAFNPTSATTNPALNNNNEHSSNIHAPIPQKPVSSLPLSIPPPQTGVSYDNHPISSSSPPPLSPSYTIQSKSTAVTQHTNAPALNSNNINVEKLEQQAQVDEKFETAIRQHVSTSMKSLYRLWKVSGMEKEEFDAVIKTELEVLGIMDEADGMGS